MFLFPAGAAEWAGGFVFAYAVAGQAHAKGAKFIDHAGHGNALCVAMVTSRHQMRHVRSWLRAVGKRRALAFARRYSDLCFAGTARQCFWQIHCWHGNRVVQRQNGIRHSVRSWVINTSPHRGHGVHSLRPRNLLPTCAGVAMWRRARCIFFQCGWFRSGQCKPAGRPRGRAGWHRIPVQRGIFSSQ